MINPEESAFQAQKESRRLRPPGCSWSTNHANYGSTCNELSSLKLTADSAGRVTSRFPVYADPAVPAPPPTSAPMAAPLPPPANAPIRAPAPAPPPIIAAVRLPLPFSERSTEEVAIDR